MHPNVLSELSRAKLFDKKSATEKRTVPVHLSPLVRQYLLRGSGCCHNAKTKAGYGTEERNLVTL
jgi:hypothetical protein